MGVSNPARDSLRPPLTGQRVVVTRAAHQAEELCQALSTAGAEVARLPLLEVLPGDQAVLDSSARDIEGFDWLVFSSANAVTAFLSRVSPQRMSATRLAVIGPATARAVRDLGFEVHLEATRRDGVGLAEVMASHLTPTSRLLLPQADDARPQLAEGLRQQGAEVVEVIAYRKALPVAAQSLAQDLFEARPLGWVTFTSPRIVRHFLQLEIGRSKAWQQRLPTLRALSVGPVTSAELRRHDVQPAAEAKQPTSRAMVEAIITATALNG